MKDREHLEAVLAAASGLNIAVRAAAEAGLVVETKLHRLRSDRLHAEDCQQVSARVMRPLYSTPDRASATAAFRIMCASNCGRSFVPGLADEKYPLHCCPCCAVGQGHSIPCEAWNGAARSGAGGTA